MLLTTDHMPGKKYEILGLVVGRYPAITDGFEKAKEKMIEEAEKLDANAIIDVHFASSVSEVVTYGTAVKRLRQLCVNGTGWIRKTGSNNPVGESHDYKLKCQDFESPKEFTISECGVI